MLRTRLCVSWNKRWIWFGAITQLQVEIFVPYLAKSTAMPGRAVLALLMLFPRLVPRLGKSVVLYMQIASPARSFWEKRQIRSNMIMLVMKGQDAQAG